VGAVKPGTIVEADWDDHLFVFNRYGGESVVPMRSVGYFVREDDQVFAIALTMQEGNVPCDVQVIDKRMLRRVRRVR
jgi:hypothetical protein